MHETSLVSEHEDCAEHALPEGWAVMPLRTDMHPEDMFMSIVVGSLVKSGCWSDALAGIAKASAQGVLDELGPDDDASHLDLDALVGRSLTLSMQRRLSRTHRSHLIRSLAHALRQQGYVVGRSVALRVAANVVEEARKKRRVSAAA